MIIEPPHAAQTSPRNGRGCRRHRDGVFLLVSAADLPPVPSHGGRGSPLHRGRDPSGNARLLWPRTPAASSRSWPFRGRRFACSTPAPTASARVPAPSSSKPRKRAALWPSSCGASRPTLVPGVSTRRAGSVRFASPTVPTTRRGRPTCATARSGRPSHRRDDPEGNRQSRASRAGGQTRVVPTRCRWAPCVRGHGPGQGQLPCGIL